MKEKRTKKGRERRAEHPLVHHVASETKWMKPKKWGHKAIRASAERKFQMLRNEFNCFMAKESRVKFYDNNWTRKMHWKDCKWPMITFPTFLRISLLSLQLFSAILSSHYYFLLSITNLHVVFRMLSWTDSYLFANGSFVYRERV